MQVLLAKGWWPESVGMPSEEATEESVRLFCIRIIRYPNETACLMSYAECMADWSTILDDSDINAVHEFVNTAVSHIINHDYDWLEQHFV